MKIPYFAFFEKSSTPPAMHAAGFSHTVVTCGTAFSNEHIALLRQYTMHIVLLFDGDRAGRMALDKACCEIRKQGLNVSQVFLHPNEDPDLLQASLGKDRFAAYIHKVTRYSRLKTYERDLVLNKSALFNDLLLALTAEERAEGLARIMKVRYRLGRVTEKLEHGVVMNMNYALNRL